ncbi:MAG: oxidoreductase [Pseudomonadota bacterium]
MASLFDPISLGALSIRNRVGLSPMSIYAATDGAPGAVEPVHYGARAIGGAGLVFTGTAAVTPEGRITPNDPGLWSDALVPGHRAIAEAIRAGGGTPAVQIGHAGRKASTTVPWRGGAPKSDGRSLTAAEGAWQTMAPTARPYGGDKNHTPEALDEAGIERIIQAFAHAAARANAAGYEVLEVHGAHGYLIHAFLSPISNRRDDAWGGDLNRRIRFAREILRAVRRAWPAEKPLAFRMPVEDFHDGGLTLEDGIAVAAMARDAGVDLVDLMSFGGVAPGADVPWTEPFTRTHARAVRAAVPGLSIAISAQTAPDFKTNPAIVNGLVASGDADLVLLGRQLLADPHWPANAATALGDDRLQLPPRYEHWLTGRAGGEAPATAAA